MGGSGSGGSGKASWPAYMEGHHGVYLDAIDALIGVTSNPYTGVAVYVPDTQLTAMDTAVAAYGTYLSSFIATYADAAVTALGVAALAELTADAIPALEAGMSAINSVQSSSFVIAEAIMMAKATASIGKEGAIIYNSAYTGLLDGQKSLATMKVEAYKTRIIAKSEEAQGNLEIEVHEETWPLDLYTYAGNMLASIGGGHSGGGPPKPDKTRSAIGGAMTGAAAGAAFGGVGAIAGAVIGGVAGYMMA